MKKILLCLFLALHVTGAFASSGGDIKWEKAPSRSHDVSALQHGAALFVNYCLNCHSAAFVRYSSLTELGLSDQQVKDYLMFPTDQLSDVMQSNQNPVQAKNWFGKLPPDLSLVARSRAGSGGSGSDYLYTFLRGFYVDHSKATGWNNRLFPNVGMPNVLWELQGMREPVYEEVEFHGKPAQAITGFKVLQPGTLSEEAFGDEVADLVAFMTWIGEPSKASRVRIGVWAIVFLLGFVLIAWRLNASFWRDVK